MEDSISTLVTGTGTVTAMSSTVGAVQPFCTSRYRAVTLTDRSAHTETIYVCSVRDTPASIHSVHDE